MRGCSKVLPWSIRGRFGIDLGPGRRRPKHLGIAFFPVAPEHKLCFRKLSLEPAAVAPESERIVRSGPTSGQNWQTSLQMRQIRANLGQTRQNLAEREPEFANSAHRLSFLFFPAPDFDKHRSRIGQFRPSQPNTGQTPIDVQKLSSRATKSILDQCAAGLISWVNVGGSGGVDPV